MWSLLKLLKASCRQQKSSFLGTPRACSPSAANHRSGRHGLENGLRLMA
ncbi:hypothetical protein FOCC_FOCC003595, partial [Frankliniella occidentalis]